MGLDFETKLHIVSFYYIFSPHIPMPDFTLLASAPIIVEAETRANKLTKTLVRWAGQKQLTIAPQKPSATLFTSDTQ